MQFLSVDFFFWHFPLENIKYWITEESNWDLPPCEFAVFLCNLRRPCFFFQETTQLIFLVLQSRIWYLLPSLFRAASVRPSVRYTFTVTMRFAFIWCSPFDYVMFLPFASFAISTSNINPFSPPYPSLCSLLLSTTPHYPPPSLAVTSPLGFDQRRKSWRRTLTWSSSWTPNARTWSTSPWRHYHHSEH